MIISLIIIPNCCAEERARVWGLHAGETEPGEVGPQGTTEGD